MSLPYDDPAVTAYALDEVGPQEKARVENLVDGSPQAQAALEETRLVARLVEEVYRAERPAPDRAPAPAETPAAKGQGPAQPPAPSTPEELFDRIVHAPPEGEGAAPARTRLRALALPITAATALVLGASIWWVVEKAPKTGDANANTEMPQVSAAGGISALAPPSAPASVPPPLPDSAFDVRQPAPMAPRPAGNSAPFADAPLIPADGGPAPAPATPPLTPKAAAAASLENDEVARAIQKEKLNALRAQVSSERSGAAATTPPAPAAFPELTVPAKTAMTRPIPLGAAGDDGQFQFTPGPLQAVTAPVVTGFSLPEVVPVSGAPAPSPDDGAPEEGPGIKMVDFGADQRAPLPFVLLSRVLASPWNPNHDLIIIALQPIAAGQAERPRANLVFLVDISTSMNAPDRLPMFKEAFSRFLDGLSPSDQVALVVYSGDSARWLGTTPVHERETIRRAFNKLATTETGRPGASLQMAYDLAHQGFIPGGFNRIIAITDGDLDLGVGEAGGLYDYVSQQARDGVTFSLVGLGREFTNSSKVRQLVRNGHGMAAATRTAGGVEIALDREVTQSSPMAVRNLKLELPLTAERVAAYRLLGYQNQFPVTGSGLSPRPGAGLLAAYETERGTANPPQPEVAIRYHRSGDADQGEESQSTPVGAPDHAAPEVVRDFEQQVADLKARFKSLPVADAKEAKPETPMPVDAASAAGAKSVNKQDYQEFRKAAESWIEPAKKPADAGGTAPAPTP